MVYDRHLIFWHYLRSGFFIDFISSIPFDIIVSPVYGSSASVLKMVRRFENGKLQDPQVSVHVLDEEVVTRHTRRFAFCGLPDS